MSKIKIVTDSTAYLTKEYIKAENISVVPLNYVFGDESGKEPFPGEFEDFYNKLASTKLFPSTSQPSAGEFVETFYEAFEEGYDEIIAIVLSSKLSGTYNSAVLAKNILENKKITIIDSLNSASNLRFLVEDAIKMSKEGKSSEEIKAHINDKKKHMYVYLTTDTLEYLSRGGRISSIQSKLGNFLNIKPILELKNGELGLLDKLRGKNKALQAIIDKIPEDTRQIGICHILNRKGAEKVKTTLEKKFPNIDVQIDELGPVIGAHLGPKGIGVCISR